MLDTIERDDHGSSRRLIEEVAELLRDRGYRADEMPDIDGILSATGGIWFMVRLLLEVPSIPVFLIRFGLAAKDGRQRKDANEINRHLVFGRAYIDADGDWIFEMEATIPIDGWRLVFLHAFDVWEGAIQQFIELQERSARIAPLPLRGRTAGA